MELITQNTKYLSMEWSCFLQVAESKNVTRASEKMGLPQSSVSKYIARLENQLHTSLFYRNNKGAQLTDSGVQHYSRLKQILTQLNLESKKVDSLTLGMHLIAGRAYLPKIYNSILNKKLLGVDKLDLKIQLGSSVELQQKVLTGEIDAAIVVEPKKYNQLVIRNISKEDVDIVFNDQPTKFLFYYPSLMKLDKLLAQYNNSQQIMIPDYELCLSLVHEIKNSATAVPSSLLAGIGQLKRKKLFSANICYVYRRHGINEENKKHLAELIKGVSF